MSASEIHAVNAKLRAKKSLFYEGETLLKLLSAKNSEEIAVHIFPEIIISDLKINVVTEFEIKLYQNTITTFKKIVRYTNTIKPILINLIRRFEIANLKKIVKAIIYPRFKNDIKFLDITPYTSFDPRDALRCTSLDELSQFLMNTPYKNIISDKIKSVKNPAFFIENLLDLQFYNELFDFGEKLPEKSSKALYEFLRKEGEIKNLRWLLRLKWYYNLTLEEAKNYVISHEKFKFKQKQYENMFNSNFEDEIIESIPEKYKKEIEKVYLQTFNRDIDFNNISFPDIEICIQKVLKNLYHYFFYKKYLTIAPILSFFRLKLIELTNLNSIVEGFRFNLNREEIKKFLI